MKNWYVAHSKPRNEELLWKQFCLRNLETYYPCIKTQALNSNAQRMQPYFPGYLFVNVDLGIVGRSSLEWIPGGAGLVSFGEEPAAVSESLISSIKQRVDSLEIDSKNKIVPFHKGDNVIVHNGVFKGYEGIFDVRLSGTDRARVLLSLLGDRQISVELSTTFLHRAF
ncbi:MAG: hypothetical protein HY863_16480 [Chloroflexi bacterium]|nr:hypothetical protein [Chloroflexota bacterium]